MRQHKKKKTKTKKNKKKREKKNKKKTNWNMKRFGDDFNQRACRHLPLVLCRSQAVSWQGFQNMYFTHGDLKLYLVASCA